VPAPELIFLAACGEDLQGREAELPTIVIKVPHTTETKICIG